MWLEVPIDIDEVWAILEAKHFTINRSEVLRPPIRIYCYLPGLIRGQLRSAHVMPWSLSSIKPSIIVLDVVAVSFLACVAL